MNKIQYQEIIAMLTVLYKKLDDLEHKTKGVMRSAGYQTYLDELKKKAREISDEITHEDHSH